MELTTLRMDKLILNYKETTAEYSLTKLTGTENVAAVDTEEFGGGMLIDKLFMANGRVVSISCETIILYDTVQDYWDAAIEGIEIDYKVINWLKDAKPSCIDRLLKLIEWPLVYADIATDNDIWEECIHPNMHNKGVLPIPFDRSFDEYNGWDDMGDNSRQEFRIWIMSIIRSLGHRWYRETTSEEGRVVEIPGFVKILISDNDFIEGLLLMPKLDNSLFECGVNMWYDHLPVIAAKAGVDLELLEYNMASHNILDKIGYGGKDAWMPAIAWKVLQFCVAEELRPSEMKDRKYMNEKYAIWVEGGLI